MGGSCLPFLSAGCGACCRGFAPSSLVTVPTNEWHYSICVLFSELNIDIVLVPAGESSGAGSPKFGSLEQLPKNHCIFWSLDLLPSRSWIRTIIILAGIASIHNRLQRWPFLCRVSCDGPFKQLTHQFC
ncbi:hypothetical protein I7I48_05772 [Histoplasma ohiense]|nr:hypothetical protein I7I48_05772 [Histoplasma ohiense (nom. inval.)]